MQSWALRTRCLTLILASLLLPADAQVRDVEVLPAAEAGIDFERDVRPILAARCHTCHGPAQQLSGLRLDRREDALKGGSSGPVIVPGRSSESRLIQLVAGMEKTLIMPPAGDRLSDQEIGRLRAWIDEGAQWPEATVLAEEGNAPGQATGHWAFQALRRPEQPLVRYQAWVRNPIDTFVLARLESEGIEPSSEADKVTLLRRACLDLTGLPLSPAQSSEFWLMRAVVPMRGCSIVCWDRNTMARSGRGIGSTRLATPIATDTKRTTRDHTPGVTGIGSSMP